MFGIGWNAVDDDGRDFCQPFDAKQSWSARPFPTRIVVDKYLKYGMSIEFAGAYNEYKIGKLINDTTNFEGFFLSFDFNAKYSFFNLLSVKWLDPYASLGLGLTQRTAFENPYSFTANVNFGANFWVYKGLGIQLQTSGKIGLTSDILGNSDYFQHTIGIVYKTKSSRGRNTFNKRRYGWIQKKQRYKSGRRNG